MQLLVMFIRIPCSLAYYDCSICFPLVDHRSIPEYDDCIPFHTYYFLYQPIIIMPKWKHDQKEFAVSVTYHE